MLGCFNPILGQIWTNPNIGLIKNVIQRLGLSIFSTKSGGNNCSFIFRVFFLQKLEMLLPFVMVNGKW